MGVDVDQPGYHELAARVEHVGALSLDVGLDRHDPPAGDRHVAGCIDPQ